MSVTVSEILLAARAALAVVSSETAGYLVLGAADCLGEGRLGLGSVYLDEGGALHVDRRADQGGGDAESSLRSLLKHLLETGRSPAPALLRVATTQERRGIPRLITEIEAALIPVNRAAARRALARLHRDISRARATSKLFDACPDDLLELSPSAAPPVVVAPARKLPPAEPRPRDVVDRSTEGPTPIVPVAAESSHAAQETVQVLEEVVHRPPETHLAAPAPLRTVEPDATPFLGTVAATVRASSLSAMEHRAGTPLPAPVSMIDDPEDDLDTDLAPPVELDPDAVEVEARGAATIVLGTYDVEVEVERDAVAAVEVEVEVERDAVDAVEVERDAVDVEVQASPSPSEAALYVAIPVVALRESTPFVEVDELLEPDAEDAVEGESLGALEREEEPEEGDALEMLLFEAAEEKEAVAETFTSMFELAPDGTAEPPKVADDDAFFDDLPPLLFVAANPKKDPDAIAEELGIDVPATPLSASSAPEELPSASASPTMTEELSPERSSETVAEEAPPEGVLPRVSDEAPPENSFGHLAEALIDEALAVAPRPVSVLPDVPEALRAPAVAHTATVPGLGFVNVAPVPPVVAKPVDVAPEEPAPREEPMGEASADEADEAEAHGDDVSPWEAARASWDEEPFFEYMSETPPDVAAASSVASTYQPRRSDVADLVAAFVVAETRSLAELARELKRIAGISATPAPVGAVSERRRKASSAR